METINLGRGVIITTSNREELEKRVNNAERSFELQLIQSLNKNPLIQTESRNYTELFKRKK